MQSTTFFGGDVSKDTISFAIYGDTQPVQVVPNQKQSLIAYLKKLPPQTLLAVEATTNYQRLLVELAYHAHMTAFVLNPKDVSAAMTAARHPVIKAFHERQLAKESSPIAAYNVLARKLLRTAWS